MKLLVFLIMSFNHYVKLEATRRFIESSSVRGFLIQNDLSLSKNAQSWMECMMTCEIGQQCKSISFDSESSVCYIYKSYNINATGIPKKGTHFFYDSSYCPNYKGYALLFAPHESLCVRQALPFAPYYEAVSKCLEDYAFPAKIDSERKQNIVNSYLRTYGYSNKKVFIQGYRHNITSDWIYDDDSSMNYFNWNSGEPDDNPLNMRIALSVWDQGVWNNVNVDKTFTILCEINLP